MFSENLVQLRKMCKMTQETLAEKIGVSRQTLSRWEAGETAPDLESASKIASALGASLDELVQYDKNESLLPVPPRGKHSFGTVQVGENGTIEIPPRAQKIFNIQSGDRLIVLGDEAQGLALVKESDFLHFVRQVQSGL